MGRAGKLFDWLWFLLFAAASSAWCITAAGEIGATFDEPTYLVRGLERWRTGSHAGLLRLGTMPLPIDAQTLPLYLSEKSTGRVLDLSADGESMLRAARAVTLAFWWLLLAYGRLAGRSVAGPWGGRLAVALLACEPNLLAHAALATTDIAVSAGVLALVYHFRTGREAGWWRRVALPAAWLGFAVLAKASGLVLGGLALLAVEAGRVWGPWREQGGGMRGLWAAFAPFRRDAAQVVALGLLLTFLYCGSDWKPEPSFVKWANGLPEGPARSGMVWLADNLRIFSNAGEGLVRQVKHNVRGHGVYLLGRAHPRAIWYYFPIALSIKLPVPVLLLPLVLAVLRPAALRNWACLAAAALLAFSLICRVQIGIRLLLPLVVLGLVGLGAAAASACRDPVPRALRRRLTAVVVTAALVWTGGSALAVWPHGLCFVNELWGGTAEGYRRVSDSNYDWGQGLKELACWQRDRGVAELDVWYFGSDPALRAMRVREVPFHVLPIEGPEDVLGWVRGRHLAVSTTLLYGMPCDTEPHRRASAFLRQLRPAARTTTFLIFDFTGESAVAADCTRVDPVRRTGPETHVPSGGRDLQKANTAPGGGPGRRDAEVRDPAP